MKLCLCWNFPSFPLILNLLNIFIVTYLSKTPTPVSLYLLLFSFRVTHSFLFFSEAHNFLLNAVYCDEQLGRLSCFWEAECKHKQITLILVKVGVSVYSGRSVSGRFITRGIAFLGSQIKVWVLQFLLEFLLYFSNLWTPSSVSQARNFCSTIASQLLFCYSVAYLA